MENTYSPRDLTAHMFKSDHFSQWLGIEVLETGFGTCRLRMTVREEMLNGFGILHGGVTFAFADSALAFASNAYGRISVALDASISYPAPSKKGDILSAYAEELNLTNKTGLYLITITNQENKKIGIFKGTVYRTGKSLMENRDV